MINLASSVNCLTGKKYHLRQPVDNAFLSIMSNQASAKDLIEASPIRYRLISSDSTTSNTVEWEEGQRIEEGEKPIEQEKVFELSLSESSFDHEHYVTFGPLFGPWKPVDRRHSFLASALEVPKNLMTPGLRDWDTALARVRNMGSLVPEETDLGSMGTSAYGEGGRDQNSVEWRVQQRQRKRTEKELREGVMGGLSKYAVKKEGENGAKAAEKESGGEKRDGSFGAWPSLNGRVFNSSRAIPPTKDGETQKKGSRDFFDPWST